MSSLFSSFLKSRKGAPPGKVQSWYENRPLRQPPPPRGSPPLSEAALLSRPRGTAGSTGAAGPPCRPGGHRGGGRLGGRAGRCAPGSLAIRTVTQAGAASTLPARQAVPSAQSLVLDARAHPERARSRPAGKSGAWGRAQVREPPSCRSPPPGCESRCLPPPPILCVGTGAQSKLVLGPGIGS